MVTTPARTLPHMALLGHKQDTNIKHELGHLTGNQFAWLLSVSSYAHFLLEPLSTLSLKAWGPRTWMTIVLLSWVRFSPCTCGRLSVILLTAEQGVVSMCQTATQNFVDLLMVRLILGFIECASVHQTIVHDACCILINFLRWTWVSDNISPFILVPS